MMGLFCHSKKKRKAAARPTWRQQQLQRIAQDDVCQPEQRQQFSTPSRTRPQGARTVQRYPVPQVPELESLTLPKNISVSSDTSLSSYATVRKARPATAASGISPRRTIVLQGFSNTVLAAKSFDDLALSVKDFPIASFPTQPLASVAAAVAAAERGYESSADMLDEKGRLRHMRRISADISLKLAEKDLEIVQAELRMLTHQQHTIHESFASLHAGDAAQTAQVSMLTRRLDRTDSQLADQVVVLTTRLNKTDAKVAAQEQKIVATDTKARRGEADIVLIRTALQEVLDVLRTQTQSFAEAQRQQQQQQRQIHLQQQQQHREREQLPQPEQQRDAQRSLVVPRENPMGYARPKLSRSNASRQVSAAAMRVDMERYKRECLDRYELAQSSSNRKHDDRNNAIDAASSVPIQTHARSHSQPSLTGSSGNRGRGGDDSSRPMTSSSDSDNAAAQRHESAAGKSELTARPVSAGDLSRSTRKVSIRRPPTPPRPSQPPPSSSESSQRPLSPAPRNMATEAATAKTTAERPPTPHARVKRQFSREASPPVPLLPAIVIPPAKHADRDARGRSRAQSEPLAKSAIVTPPR